MNTTHENALRRLDAADPAADAGSLRAQADLARILRTPRDASTAPARRAHRPVARIVAGTGAVAAAAATVLVVLPSLTGDDRAFASWTPQGTALTAVEADQAADDCRAAQSDAAGSDLAPQLAAARPALAERRGDWTTVVLTGPGGFDALCVTNTSAAGDMFGSIGVPDVDTSPAARSIEITDLGTGTIRSGDLSLVAGLAGADIVGVTYRSPSRGDVEATVTGGHFALWFPGDELLPAESAGIELTLTFTDGSEESIRARLGS